MSYDDDTYRRSLEPASILALTRSISASALNFFDQVMTTASMPFLRGSQKSVIKSAQRSVMCDIILGHLIALVGVKYPEEAF